MVIFVLSDMTFFPGFHPWALMYISIRLVVKIMCGTVKRKIIGMQKRFEKNT